MRIDRVKNQKIKTACFLLVAVLCLGFVSSMMPRASFAAGVTARTNYRDDGFVDWLAESGDQYSRLFYTKSNSRGWVCVDTNFNRHAMPYSPSYRWKIYQLTNYGWVHRATSNKFSANGNVDHQCIDHGILAGGLHQVKFDMVTPGPVTAWGDYVARGYQGSGL
jgi:hypothetical protein